MTSSTVKTICEVENNIANKSLSNLINNSVLSELEFQNLQVRTDDKTLNSENKGVSGFDDLLKLMANKLNLSYLVDMK